MHRLRILFLRFYTPPDSFLSILLFRLGPLAEISTSTGTDCGTASSDARAALAAFERPWSSRRSSFGPAALGGPTYTPEVHAARRPEELAQAF